MFDLVKFIRSGRLGRSSLGGVCLFFLLFHQYTTGLPMVAYPVFGDGYLKHFDVLQKIFWSTMFPFHFILIEILVRGSKTPDVNESQKLHETDRKSVV